MASPFKTQETMDLARALLEEDSSPPVSKGSKSRTGQDDCQNYPDQLSFRALVVTKDSSTELIPTHLAGTSDTNVVTEKPGVMMELLRDFNAGKSMVDDDGKPLVGKVFSRVIQVSSGDKPKQLKVRRGAPTKREERCPAVGCTGGNKERQIDRPNSSLNQTQDRQTITGPATITNVCPACNKQFSDETMKHHLVFCNGSSKEIM